METKSRVPTQPDERISKVKLALGAVSLFLFVVGLKKSYRSEDGSEILSDSESRTSVEPPDMDQLDGEPLRAAS
jgi:hypothetical protein